MNPPKSVGLSCRAVRAWRSVSEAPDGRGFGAAHIAQCADCQRFYAAEASFERTLRQDAVRQFEQAPAGLEQSILRSVREARVVAPEPRRSSRTLLFSGAAIAAAAVAAVAVLQTGPVVPDAGSAPRTAMGTTTPAPNAEPGNASLTELATPVKQAIADSSLQSEVDLVYADARTAVRFLAANFLPTGSSTPASTARRADG